MAIGFNNVGGFSGVAGGPNVLSSPTSLQFGPDGRLYVSEQNGSINAFTVTLQDGNYIATAHEELTLANGGGVVKSIQNHNDDGSLNSGENRQVTGIVVTGDADNPVLYISSSDPRIASGGEVNLDTNSGVVTRVTWTGSEWEAVDIIRGLPRSEENHAVNGMTLSDDGTKLYLMVGGNTNNGAPSAFFSYTNEYALSGTLLEIDLTDIEQRSIVSDAAGGRNPSTNSPYARDYVYDLPTLDDPNIANVTDGVGEDANGMDEAGPWGGNDGLNMGILPADAPFRIYADGFRNAFDVTFRDGQLYTVDNGSNGNLGGNPIAVNGEATTQVNNGGSGDPEPLFRIVDGDYYGHPNPARSNQDLEWNVYNNSGSLDGSLATNNVPNLSALVPAGVNIQAGYIIDPSKFSGEAARLLESGIRVERDSAQSNNIVTVGSSTNGIIEYTGDAFDGALNGAIVVTQFNDTVTLLNVNASGTGLESVIDPGPDGVLGTGDDVVADQDGIFFLQSGLSNPLDLTMGPNGTIWVAEIGGNKVSVLAPSDLVLPDDPDADNDGLLNTVDPFVRDASNGGSVTLFPGQNLLWNFAEGANSETPGPGGYGGGLTGVMVNGTTDFEQFFQDTSTIDGQIIKLDNVKFTTAAGGGNTVIEVVSTGDPFQGQNDGEFLFHTGITVAPTVDEFTVKWTVFNPAGDTTSNFSESFQQIGGYIGTGDQSNYLKIVAIQSPSGEIQVALEDGDSIVDEIFIQADDLFAAPDGEKIFFELTINPDAATATPTITYGTGGGNTNTVTGAPLDLTGTAVLDAIKGDYSVNGQSTGLAVGLFSSNTGPGNTDATSFQALFDDIEITATGDETSTVLYRVNAGGGQLAALDGGPVWSADTSGNPSGFLAQGGNNTNGFAVTPGNTVAPTTPDAIFTTERWDPAAAPEMQWAFPVTQSGPYEVRLFMGNGFGGTDGAGDRVFDVSIEGNVLANLDNVDLSGQFGHLTGAMISNIVQVNDGMLNIEFTHGVENPLINGIEIIQLGGGTPNLPVVSIIGGGGNVDEGAGQVQISIASDVTVPSGEIIDVTFQIVPNSATAGVDYSYDSDTADFDQNTGIYTDTKQIVGSSSDLTFLVDIVPDSEIESDETFTVNLINVSANAEIGTASATVTIDDDDFVVTPGDVLFRINAGGPEVAANDGGPAWTEDQAGPGGTNGSAQTGTPSQYLVDRGVANDDVTYGDNTPPGPGNNATGAPDALFVTERFSEVANPNNIGYAFDVANGDYTVNLYFDELFFTATGSRIFDVDIEGNLVLDDFDTFANYGNNTGLESFNTTVSDGELNIEFLKGAVNNPHVAAIEIIAADDAPELSLLSIGAPTPSSVQEMGDTGTTDLIFSLDFDTPPVGQVIVDYSVDINGTVTTGSVDATTTPSITVNVANDDLANGPEDVSVTLTGISTGDDLAQLSTASASATVTEDDIVVTPGDIIARINAGGAAIADPNGAWEADTSGSPSQYRVLDGGGPNQFTSNATILYDPAQTNGVPQALFNTERWDPSAGEELKYAFDVPVGDYDINLYMVEGSTGQSAVGARIFDVSVEGSVPGVFDDIEPYVIGGSGNGGAGNGAFVLSYTQTVTDGTLNLEFLHDVIENPKINAIEIVAASDGPDLSLLSIGAPTPASVQEMGDTGTTDLIFSLDFDTPPGGQVIVDYSVDINGVVTTGSVDATSTPSITVSVDNDDIVDGPENVLVTLTGISTGDDLAQLGTASASATVTEDDVVPGPDGAVVAAINAGGPALSQDGIDFQADAFSLNGSTFTDGSSFDVNNGNGAQPALDGTVFETERFGGADGGTMSYEIPVDAGNYDIQLYFAEIFQSNPGTRVFDVTVEGELVLDDFDILGENGGDINASLIRNILDVDPAAFDNPNAIDIDFSASVDNAKISGIVVREGDVVPEPTGGAAIFSVTLNTNTVDGSNFGNNSFQITNTGTKKIASVEIDVSNALYPDTVFDPFGVAGDTIAKLLTINTNGGTGVVAPDHGTNTNPGTSYIGTGGVAGFEGIQLLFDNAVNGGFENGETLGFAVDMDPNSIAGAVKGTLDSGADASANVGGGDNDWDIGGVSGAELIGSTYTITFEDGTTATGQLQGNDNQGGAKGVASQDSPNLGVTLTVNNLPEGGVGNYDASGPNVVINGPAGQTARIVLTKGFIQPGDNNFTNAYAATLDAQLNALAATDFPANNAVEFQTVDILLTGGDQDISNLFDVSQLLNGVDFGGGWTDLAVDQLPLGFVAGIIDPADGNPLGPVSAPIYLQFAENAAPIIDPIADITIDELGEAAFTVSASDNESDPIALSVAVTRDSDSSVVDPANYSFTDNGDGTGAFSWVTEEPDDGAYTVTVTADDGTSQSTETLALVVNEVADPQPGDVLYRVNAGGAQADATDGGPVWTADTQQANSPYLVNPGSNNDFPTNGLPTPTPIDTSLLTGANPGQAVLGIERWDNANGGNALANEMQWAFDVNAGTEVEIRLYFAELFTTIPDENMSGDPVGDRVFDVSVDGIVPEVFDNIDPYALGGNSFFSASVLTHQTISDGTIDLAFLHGVENPAIKGIEIVVGGTPDSDGPAATLTSAPDVAAAGDSYQFTVQYTDATAIDVSTIDNLDVTVTNGAISFETTASLVSVNVPSDGTPRTATYEITPPGGTWDPADNGTYTITLEDAEIADILGNPAVGGVLGTFEVDTTPDVVEGGSALIAITPGQGLNASTFGGSSFQITNNSANGLQIEQVTFDLSTAILPDMVFDPTGAGGDATASPFTPNMGAALTGLVVPGNPASDPFSVPRNGGFDVLTVDFTEFDPGEQFTFTTDVDPNSIQGVPNAGNAGAVSGYELVGSTITVTYSNGTTSKVATGSLFQDGSLGGGTTTVTTEDAPATPTLAVLGGGADQSPNLPGTQLTVSTQNPTIVVTGTPGDQVELLQMDARLFIATNAPPFDVAPDELPFYANEAMSGQSVYSATIGQDGTVAIPVALLETQGSGSTPDGGLNHFKAVVTSGGQQSQTSETLVLKFGTEPGGLPTPIVDMPGVMTFNGTNAQVLQQPHSQNLQISQGTVAFSFNAADTNGAQGLFTKDASGFAGGGNHFVVYLQGSTLVARFQDGSNSATFQFAGIQAGTEYDIAATFDPSGSRLYVDGIEVASDPLVMNWTNNVEYIQWGGRGWGSASGQPGFDAPFEGTITDKQIYGVALTPAQVAVLHTGDPGGNEAPVFTSAAAASVAENTTAVIDVDATDVNGDTLTYDISGGADAAAFAIDADTGALSFVNAPDYEAFADDDGDNVYEVEVEADDGNNGVTTQAIAVTVTDVDEGGPNQAPVFTSAAATSVAENTTAVIDVDATDADGDTLTFSLTGGDDQGAFQIDENTGVLSFVAAPDFEVPTDAGGNNVYDVEVTADDNNGGVTTQAIAVTVTDVDEDPSVFPEPIYDVPGVMTFNGSNGGVQQIPHDGVFSIPQGTVAFSFNAADTVGAQGLFTKDASGFVGGGNHFVLYLQGSTLVARFQDGSDSATFQQPGIQAGLDYDIAATFGPEGSKLFVNGAQVGVTSPLVMNWTQNVEYIQWGGRGWGSQSGQPGFDAPFEGTITDKQIYDVALSQSQIGELFQDAPNQAPVFSSDDTVFVPENTLAAIDIDATDPDGDSVTYSLTGGADQSAFTIDATSGVLSFQALPDFENPTDSGVNNVYEVAVTASDGKGGSTVQNLAVTVTDLPEAGNQPPVITSVDAISVPENTTAVIEVEAEDPDPGDLITYTLTGGADQGLFTINDESGVLSFTTAPDFEMPEDANGDNLYEVEVTATDIAGDSDAQNLAVTVTDLNEDPDGLPDPVFSQNGVKSYNGSSGQVDNYAPNPALNIAEGTIAFSFVDDNPGVRQGLVVKDASGYVGGGNHFAAYIESGDLKVRFQDGGAETIFVFDDLVAGTEYEVAATFGADGSKLYVDGELEGQSNLVMDWTSNVEYLQVGGLGWGSATGAPNFTNPFSGQIADVQIFAKALDPDDINSLAGTSSFPDIV